MAFLLDGVLALGKGVPQLDRLVTGAGNDLSRYEEHKFSICRKIQMPCSRQERSYI